MYKYLKNKEIDRQKWDAAINQAENGLIYGFSWYLDIVSEHWDAVVYGDYELLWPLPWNKKMGIYSIYPPILAQQLGPFSNQKIEAEHLIELLFLIPQHFKKVHLTLGISLGDFDETVFDSFRKVAFENICIRLNHDYSFLQKHYSKNTRRNLGKAQKNGLEKGPDLSVKDCIELFRKNKGEQLDFGASFYETIEQIMRACLEREMGEIRTVVDEKKELVAAAFFAQSHQGKKDSRIYNLLPASTSKGKSLGAMFFLIDDLIQQYANQPVVLDFEGSMVEGVARFYKGFGGEEQPYWHVSQNKLTGPLRVLYDWYKAIS